MNSYVVLRLQQYRTRGILVDTNILLLYFVGSFRRDLITQFKRTKKFTEKDFDTLRAVLAPFKKIVTTPHILAEVSNLSSQFSENLQGKYFDWFAAVIERVFDEEYVPSVTAMQGYRRLGLTDAGIIHLAQGRYLVLSDDFPLSK